MQIRPSLLPPDRVWQRRLAVAGACSLLLAVLYALPAASARSSLQPQTVLDAIHQALHPGDHTQNNNCHIGGYNPFPKVPCRHDRILPTTAFLTPSRGGFTTACDNPYISTYHYYEITPAGQRFYTCGPLGVWPHKAHVGEFQPALDHLGQMIEAVAGVSAGQTTTRVGGNRQAIVATYQCPSAGTDASTSGVKEVRIGRSGRTIRVGC
jgi:hypothetical protein